MPKTKLQNVIFTISLQKHNNYNIYIKWNKGKKMCFFCGLWNLLGINNNYKVVENGCKISEINFFCVLLHWLSAK